MQFETILLEKKDAVATITLNRPHALNSLTAQSLTELIAAFKDLRADRSIRVVVLRGAGTSFCTGLDLKDMGQLIEGGADEIFVEKMRQGLYILELIETMDKPVVAAVQGYAITGGFWLAYICDIIIAAEDAQFQDTHARWGIVPGFDEAQTLPRLVGIHRAKQLFFLSRRLSAREALEFGLVYKVVPNDQLEAATQEVVDRLLSQSAASLRLIKAQINRGLKCDWATGSRVDWFTRQGQVSGDFITPEAVPRLRAFREKQAKAD
ncbi:MAG TPA: enoyl-CoA hydratase/isomerase family protein [Dehalococcoidia bacterium]|jgi:enoyl-CoA hydratase/carnithine racemase|nr:enoyl-CoA hydratase/isomerase family protein [Dehalococcoidia bacterium]